MAAPAESLACRDCPKQTEHKRPLLCFTDRNPTILLSTVSKIVGSAQRRRAGAVLQHGSLLLASIGPHARVAGSATWRTYHWRPREWADHLVERIHDCPGITCDSPMPVRIRCAMRARQACRDEIPRPGDERALISLLRLTSDGIHPMAELDGGWPGIVFQQ